MCKRVREFLVLRFGWPGDEDCEANTDLGFVANCVCVHAGLFHTQLFF